MLIGVARLQVVEDLVEQLALIQAHVSLGFPGLGLEELVLGPPLRLDALLDPLDVFLEVGLQIFQRGLQVHLVLFSRRFHLLCLVDQVLLLLFLPVPSHLSDLSFDKLGVLLDLALDLAVLEDFLGDVALGLDQGGVVLEEVGEGGTMWIGALWSSWIA